MQRRNVAMLAALLVATLSSNFADGELARAEVMPAGRELLGMGSGTHVACAKDHPKMKGGSTKLLPTSVEPPTKRDSSCDIKVRQKCDLSGEPEGWIISTAKNGGGLHVKGMGPLAWHGKCMPGNFDVSQFGLRGYSNTDQWKETRELSNQWAGAPGQHYHLYNDAWMDRQHNPTCMVARFAGGRVFRFRKNGNDVNAAVNVQFVFFKVSACDMKRHRCAVKKVVLACKVWVQRESRACDETEAAAAAGLA